ncbi:MAG TPA: tetratricopeptide repeat protein, partial [Chryseolinea sp.]|nr:tetratricopeptide repeat protein [Chryseolinea sp.]
WAYRNKGIYYLKMNEPTDAIRMLEQAVGLDPYIDEVHTYLSEAYLHGKEYDKACKAYQKAIENKERAITSMKPCK